MRRLYLQLYLTIVAGLIAVVIAGGALWRLAAERPFQRHAFELAGEVATFVVPSAEAGADEARDVLKRLHDKLRVDLALYSADGGRIAAAGAPVPRPDVEAERGGWVRGAGGSAWAIPLPDGRWLVARTPRPPPSRQALGLLGFLAIMGSLIALAALPVARRLTRRLERLQESVDKLGRGDLKARVEVEGRDEVARLATSFNAAAGRIEELVGAHKLLLANASHELRTPLARIRLGIELLAKGDAAPARVAALKADIAELDDLVDNVLLSSRLEALGEPDAREEVDLLALAAEEAARDGGDDTDVSGQAVTVRGDPRLLRRLVRNLIDNTRRHGAPPIVITVEAREGRALLAVADTGPGIAEADRERIFEPFRRGAGSGSGGTGLGLALVRQIARRHGGEVRVAATGSAIEVTLPR